MRLFGALLLVLCGSAHAAVSPPFIAIGDTAPKVQVDIRHATTGALLTGLASTTIGTVSCLPSDTATAFVYVQSTDIEAITTVGTYVNPGTGDLAVKETASTGIYEFQFEPGLWDNATSTSVTCKVSGATNALDRTFTVSQQLSNATQFAAALASSYTAESLAKIANTDAIQSVVDNIDGNTDSEIASLLTNVAAVDDFVDTEVAMLVEALVGLETELVADSGTTTTIVDAALTQATNDWFAGQGVVFTSSTLEGQTACVTGFTAASDTLTITAVTTAVTTHSYYILPMAKCGALNPGAIVAGSFTAGAIDAAAIAVDAIGASEVATGAIDSTAIAANAITATTIAADAITAAKIANDAIGATEIANAAIDAATFAVDVDAEILSYIVDDATRIDASELNADIDSLVFTKANELDVNVQSVNGATLTGDGSGTPFNVVSYRQFKNRCEDAGSECAQFSRAIYRALRDRAIYEYAGKASL